MIASIYTSVVKDILYLFYLLEIERDGPKQARIRTELYEQATTITGKRQLQEYNSYERYLAD